MLAKHQDGAVTECEPSRCPCDDGACALSRYVRMTSGNRNGSQIPLTGNERAVAGMLAGMPVDMESMAAVQNLSRAANAVRNHLERTVLAPHDLTWSGWVVLWVMWSWGDIESHCLAAEAGISKGTLTGVVSTLEKRGLVHRQACPGDARRLLVSFTPEGRRLMQALFLAFNREETHITAVLGAAEKTALAGSLRKITMHVAG